MHGLKKLKLPFVYYIDVRANVSSPVHNVAAMEVDCFKVLDQLLKCVSSPAPAALLVAWFSSELWAVSQESDHVFLGHCLDPAQTCEVVLL